MIIPVLRFLPRAIDLDAMRADRKTVQAFLQRIDRGPSRSNVKIKDE